MPEVPKWFNILEIPVFHGSSVLMWMTLCRSRLYCRHVGDLQGKMTTQWPLQTLVVTYNLIYFLKTHLMKAIYLTCSHCPHLPLYKLHTILLAFFSSWTS
jgi:hypothetical protein